MVDTYTGCSGYEFYVASYIAEQQMRRAMSDDHRIRLKLIDRHPKPPPVGEHDWQTTMDGFSSKNYWRCTRCGARSEYAAEADDA